MLLLALNRKAKTDSIYTRNMPKRMVACWTIFLGKQLLST